MPAKHAVDRKTATPALGQTGTAINTRNTWCMISKSDSFDIQNTHSFEAIEISPNHYITVATTQHTIAFTAS